MSVKIISKDKRHVKEIARKELFAEKNSCAAHFEAEGLLADGEVLICDVKSDNSKDRAFYCHGALEMCHTSVDVKADREKRLITVTAKEKYVHSVTISGNIILEDNCFSLLPKESRTVAYRRQGETSDESLSVEAYTLV